MRISKKEKKRLIIITFTIISLLALLVGSVYNDWVQILKNKKLVNDLTNQYENLLDNEERLNSEIVKLQDNDYLARYAKEKYMMSSEGDTIIKMD